MKKFISIFLFIGIFFIVGCSNNNLEEINYNDFKKLMDDKETFILYISSNDCHNCTSFTPKLESVLEEYNVDSVKKIEIDTLNNGDKNDFNKIINVSGTPTVAFIENGEEKSMTNRITGNDDKDKIVTRFKANGYIK